MEAKYSFFFLTNQNIVVTVRKITSVTILLYKYKIIVLEVKQKQFYILTIKAIQIDNRVKKKT